MKALKIVLADDDPAMRELITDALTRRGHSLTVVQSGTELLKLLSHDSRYDVVVTDNKMPGGPDGLEVMRELRLDKRFKQTPIILHTGDEGDELRAAVVFLGGLFAPKRDAFSPLFVLVEELARE